MLIEIGYTARIAPFHYVHSTLRNLKTCGQGARKSAAKTALFRAPLALTVSIDLSASGGEQGEVRVGPQGEQAAPGRLRCEYEIRIQMVGRGSTLVLDDFEAILSI